jgi:Mg2+ and Co2+ transporter CorA
MEIDEFNDQIERMGTSEFIEQFERVIEINRNYIFILEDLNNKTFPFHSRNKHISYRRYYYWLKQHNKLKFKDLNNHLKTLVKNKIA